VGSAAQDRPGAAMHPVGAGDARPQALVDAPRLGRYLSRAPGGLLAVAAGGDGELANVAGARPEVVRGAGDLLPALEEVRGLDVHALDHLRDPSHAGGDHLGALPLLRGRARDLLRHVVRAPRALEDL